MEIRLSYSFTQPLTRGYGKVRLAINFIQPIVGAYSKVHLDRILVSPIIDGWSEVRLNHLMLQTLFPVQPERPMSTAIFPGFGNSDLTPSMPEAKDPFWSPLPGLAYSVHKKPYFKTNIKEAANGNEIRGSLMPMPRWDFEFNYEFLEDSTGAQSSLKTIMGFFLQMGGSYESFLVKDPDDYLVTEGLCGISTGTDPEFPLNRPMGSFLERVGQVDLANPISVYVTLIEVYTIPNNSADPITVEHADGYIKTLSVTTDGDPAAYTVEDGVYTFPVSNQGARDVSIRYQYLVEPANYTVQMPNSIVMHSTPPEDSQVHASFQFFFACRFLDDQMDFEKFQDELWSLQSCNFRSIIQ